MRRKRYVKKKKESRSQINLDKLAKSIEYSSYLVKDRLVYIMLALKYLAGSKWFKISGLGKIKFRSDGLELRFEDRLKKLLRGERLSYEEFKKILWE
mgnify:CR=1 FL=1